MVQTVGFGLAGRLAHILAVPEQAVEMELVGVFTVGGQTGITGEEGKGKEVNASSAEGRKKKDTDQRLAYFSWNCRKPGLTCGLAFSNEVVAKVELGMEAGIWGMLPVSCFQASREGGGEL